LTMGKALVAVILLAAGIGSGFGRFDPPRAPETPAPAIVPAARPIPQPAPKRDWVTVKGRVVFPEKRELPKPREILKTDRIVKDADHCFADGKRLFFEELVI